MFDIIVSFLAIWRNCRVAIRISNHPLQLITGNKKTTAAKTEVVLHLLVLAVYLPQSSQIGVKGVIY